MPWPSGSTTPGKSFKPGFGSSPSRSFSGLSTIASHDVPYYARNLLFSSLHEGARREQMHARARRTRDGISDGMRPIVPRKHIHMVRPLSRLRTHGNSRRGSYLQSGRGRNPSAVAGLARSRLSLSTVRGFAPGGRCDTT